jgi:glycosyltransferase involved in cell wall biosynthesis
MSRTAVIVSTKYPFPSDDGKKTVLAGFLGYLLERFGKENVLYVVIGRKPPAVASDKVCRTVWIEPPGLAMQAWNFFKCISGIENKSMQEALTYSPTVKHALHALIGPLRPELLILDTLRIGQYFWSSGDPGCRLVLYMDDLFSLRFRRMTEVSVKIKEVRFDPSGTFSSNLPGLARAVIQFGPVQQYLFRMEAERMEFRERDSTTRFDSCLLINPNEAQLLRDQCPGRPISAVTPVLFQSPCTIQRKFDGSPLFLLFGSLRHPVYRSSVIRFLQSGMDGILQIIPNARICMIGEGADDEIRSLCRRFGGQVEPRGFVDNLDTVFSTACALLVPLLAAGGLKLKTLTALYYGLPIIATDSGVDGIPLIDGTHFLSENAIERFPVHMLRLMDVPYNLEISRNASMLFSEHYSKERIYRDYDGLMGSESKMGIEASR